MATRGCVAHHRILQPAPPTPPSTVTAKSHVAATVKLVTGAVEQMMKVMHVLVIFEKFEVQENMKKMPLEMLINKIHVDPCMHEACSKKKESYSYNEYVRVCGGKL